MFKQKNSSSGLSQFIQKRSCSALLDANGQTLKQTQRVCFTQHLSYAMAQSFELSWVRNPSCLYNHWGETVSGVKVVILSLCIYFCLFSKLLQLAVPQLEYGGANVSGEVTSQVGHTSKGLMRHNLQSE